MPVIRIVDVHRDQIGQLLPLRRGKPGGANAGVVEHHVILERFGEIIVFGFRKFENRFFALRVVERVHHGEAFTLLVLQNGRALVFTGGSDYRLRSGEEGRHHYLVA